MRTISVRQVQSDKDVQFTGAIAQNAGENEDFASGLELKECALVGIEVISKQNLDWEIWFSSKTCATNFGNTDLDLDGYLGRCLFAVADGKQSTDSGVTSYYYSKEMASPIILRDDTTTNTKFNLHMRLVNRNATAKNAGATGEIVVKLAVDTGIK